LLNKFKVKQEHAAKFGRLITDAGGRMKPINTFRQSYGKVMPMSIKDEL
jgi:hypothetical protein